jgi:hypothetical protein
LPPSLASRPPPSARMSPAARCPRPTGASAANPFGGPRRSADGAANDHARPLARSHPNSRGRRGTRAAITTSRCRIAPFIDQAAPLRGAGPGVSARLSLDEARLAHAGHTADGTQINSAHSASRPVLLGGRLPRRMIIQLAATAPRALPAVASHAIGFADPRPTLDPESTHQVWRLSRKIGDEQATAITRLRWGLSPAVAARQSVSDAVRRPSGPQLRAGPRARWRRQEAPARTPGGC